MTEHLTLTAIAERLLTTDTARRRIVAFAGAPGSGKSTAAERLKQQINAERPGCVDIVPMDGFHLDDIVLNARGHRTRKGAPHTFDLDGFHAILARLRRDDGRDIAVPVFDRSIETARAGAGIIDASTRIVVAEGNYLLLDEPGWRDLAPLFDVTVMIVESEAVLVERLGQRWRDLGYDPAAIQAKLESNDLPNTHLVLKRSLPADIIIQSNDGHSARTG